MNSGLCPIKPDHRDYDFHRTFGLAAPPSFPQEYSTDLGQWMPNQNAMGTPYGCTGFAGADTCSGEDGVLYDPLDLYRRTPPFNNTEGRDMRKMLGITIKEGLKRWLLTEEPGFKRKAYFQIKQGTIIDMFDSIRLAMLSTSDEHRAVIAGIPWFSVFQVTKPDGILKTPTFEKDYTWHAVKIAGWTTVYGVTYLKVKSWQGENFGDNGWCYMPRELCNVLFSYSGSAAFTVTKVKPDQIQTANLNVVDTIVSYVRYLWGKMNSV